MSILDSRDMRFLDTALEMGSGYCLDFSDRTFRDFFFETLNVDIDELLYHEGGSSKGKRMRHFLRTESDRRVARLLRALWRHRADNMFSRNSEPDVPGFADRYQEIIARLEGAAATPSTDAIDTFTEDETLEELVAAIQRDIDAGSPEVVLDRLHTYCMKKLAHLVTEADPAAKPATTLNARLGQYLGPARKAARAHHPASYKIMTAAIETFELFNGVRNERSLAHDNQLIDRAEARFIFDAIVNVLRFIKTTEGASFEPGPVAPASIAATPHDEIPF